MAQYPKRISQIHIAKELGYSQALVSMVLNGRKQGISDAAYQRIWEYAVAHGYSPRGMNLDSVRNTHKTTTVGYILRSPLKLANKSNFFSHVHQGLYDCLYKNGLKLVFIGSEDDIPIDNNQELRTLTDSIKGIAIMGEVKPKVFDALRSLELPIVYVSARATGKCHSVISDEAESCSLLVDHLYKLGHRSFAWLGGNKSLARHHERHAGVADALKRYGLSIDPKFDTRFKGGDRMEGYEGAKQIIEASDGNLPTAWICLNSLMARGAINYLFQNGCRIPQDVSIAAIDMTNVCIEENPQITCASALPEQMGLEAARILIESVNGSLKSKVDITLPSQLRELNSTGQIPSEPAQKEA
jgi:LacI family transcriptional regulator